VKLKGNLLIKIEGLGGISAEIVAHSKSAVDGQEIITYVLEYPRFIHSELMTHRVFSRNAASSRAIPVSKTIDAVISNPAMPIHWGKNQSGMQAKEELSGIELGSVVNAWKEASQEASAWAEYMTGNNAHKQIVNRILEPFVFMRTIVTATEWDNWFHLRLHEDAQPEIHELARVMLAAKTCSAPEELQPGEWHTPFVTRMSSAKDGSLLGYAIKTPEDIVKFLTIEQALVISASCCAQVSFRKNDDSLEKAEDIYRRLVESKPVHASPLEHQATPMEFSSEQGCSVPIGEVDWQEGVTHMDKNFNLWSGNFKGWIQYRQLIPGNVYKGEE
jgi:thymidylate synthase ThyX